MCGLAGWVSYDGDLRAQSEIINAMTETMSRRGPDAGGVWLDRHVALGHRRLAVIDVEGGVQPMLAETERTDACLVYTGEVYNFVELRQELVQLGHRFHTRSDTEVVLRAYLQWGEGMAERLNGIFAFAIWDAGAEELILVRDRLGVKPLYYYRTADGVLVGSEPKAILAHPDVAPRVNREGFCELLLLVKNPERTVYSGMCEVRPGQIVRVSRRGLTRRRFWMLNAAEHQDDLPLTIRTVRDLLHDTVRRQMITDVPLCALLSGGLDSSIITAIAHRELEQQRRGPLRTFSLEFAQHGAAFVAGEFHETEDAPFVRDMVAHTGCEHTRIVLESAELADVELRRKVLQASDFPLSASGDMFTSLYRFCERVSAESTVALAGDASDEIFGGYAWFHDPQAVEGDTFPWAAIVGGDIGFLDPSVTTRLDVEDFLGDSYSQGLAEVPVHAEDSPIDRRMREIGYLHVTRLLSFLLDRSDRMSASTPLELRVPFCDHRLVEYVFNVPWHMKNFDGREKSILRAVARGLLPDSVLRRRKTPYPSTQDPRYDVALRAEVSGLLADPSRPGVELLNRPRLKGILKRPLGASASLADRIDLERARSLCAWMNDSHVALDF